MSKKSLDAVDKQMETEKAVESVVTLTKDHIKQIRWIISQKEKLVTLTTDIKEDVKGLAEKLGVKPGKVNALITVIIQEEAKGGVIREKTSVLDLAEQVVSTPPAEG